LVLAFVLASPPVSAAAPGIPTPTELLLSTTVRHAAIEPASGAVAGVRFCVEIPAAGGPFEKDVDPWDDDLDGKKPPSPPSGATAVGDELCALGEQDDHGDVPLCDTPVGSDRTVAGVLHNDAGDDEELFIPLTAVITVEADSVLQLVLRDRDGLAVAAAESEGRGAPLRLARALAVGCYLLEVESLNGDDAVYALTLHRPSRP
jgi:hypothetical protein